MSFINLTKPTNIFSISICISQWCALRLLVRMRQENFIILFTLFWIYPPDDINQITGPEVEYSPIRPRLSKTYRCLDNCHLANWINDDNSFDKNAVSVSQTQNVFHYFDKEISCHKLISPLVVCDRLHLIVSIFVNVQNS